MKIGFNGVKRLYHRTNHALSQAATAMRIPQSLAISDVLLDTSTVTFGAYKCEVSPPSSPVKAALRHEILAMRRDSLRALPSVHGVMSKRLATLIEVCNKALGDDDSDAFVTVRDPQSQLAAFAFVSDASMYALQLDILASSPRCLLGAKCGGPTAGEAALGACVLLSARCGTAGMLELTPESTARGWYLARGFEPQGIGRLRLGSMAAKRLVATMRASDAPTAACAVIRDQSVAYHSASM